MAAATPADPNVSGSANPEPEDVNSAAITQLPQRVGSTTPMPVSLPNDVNAVTVDYHTPVTTPGSNTPEWGGEGGPSGTYVPNFPDTDDFPNISAPVQGGGESQSTAAPGLFTRTNVPGSHPGGNPYPNDVHAPAITPHVPTNSSGSDTPSWSGEGAPDTTGEQDDLGNA